MSRFIKPTSLRLPDEKHERHATWLEIFFDLIFAVLIVQLSDRLSKDFTLIGLLKCAGLLVPSIWTWTSYTVFAARFDNNDAVHWLMTFITMFAGAIMAIQIPDALEDGGTGFSIGFILSQITLLFLYSRPHHEMASAHKLTHFYLTGFGLGVLCWIVSLLFDPPEQFYFWILGMFIYLAVPWIGKKHILSKAPLDTIYIPERLGAFTVIILGQIVTSVVLGLESASWHFTSVVTSMMAFALAIIIWGQYYWFTQVADYKCTLGSGQPYIYAHIPLIFSLMVIGVCAQFFISNTDIDETVRNTFCCSIILYMSSFFLLQYIALPNIRIRGIACLGGTSATLCLFYLFTLTPMIIMTGVVLIFLTLFTVQYLLGYKYKHTH